jgi:hypothetical protein
VVTREANTQHRRLVDQIWVELDVAEPHRGRMKGRLREADSGPASDRLGRHAEDGFGDEKVVGEIEVRRQLSAGKPLENLAIPLHDRLQSIAKGLVGPLPRDVFGDRFADSLGEADSLSARNGLEFLGLVAGEPQCHVLSRHSDISVS